MKQLSTDQLLSMISDEDKLRLQTDSGLRGADAFVVFENLNTESAEHGRKTIVPVSPSHKFASVSLLEGAWIGSGDDQRSAVGFCLNTDSIRTGTSPLIGDEQ